MTAPEREQHRTVRPWPVWLLAAPAAVAIWSGWVGLGQLAGFGVVHPLPGIWDSLTINTAITLPIGMECYAAFALRAWLTPGVPDRARRFARASAIGALALGALGQIVYHLMAAAGVSSAPWPVTALVACLPVGVLGMGAALAHLLRDHDDGDPAAEQTPTVPKSGSAARPDSQTTAVTEPGDAEVAQSRTAGTPEHRAAGPDHPDRPDPPVADRTAQTPRTGQAAPVALAGPGHHTSSPGPVRATGPRQGTGTPARTGPGSTGGTRDGGGRGRTGSADRAGTDAELLERLRRLAATEGRPGRNRAARELGVGSGRAARLLDQLDHTTDPGTGRAA